MNRWIAGRFVWFCRALLSIGYFAPGLTKALGHRFTQIPATDTTGFFFEALYRTGLYWHFLGWAQIIAAILVLFTLTAPLGSFLFFALSLNVFIITLSMPFSGTPLITGGMLLASLYLVAWEYPRWKLMIPTFSLSASNISTPVVKLTKPEQIGLSLFIIGGLMVTLTLRGISIGSISPITLAISGGVLSVIAFVCCLYGSIRLRMTS